MAEQIPREIIGKPLRIRCMSEDAFGVFCVAGKVLDASLSAAAVDNARLFATSKF